MTRGLSAGIGALTSPARNRFPPPGSNERSRDPPPDPLTDGALRGAVGASGAGRLSCRLANRRSRRRTAPRSARSTAIRSAPRSSRLAATAASASAVTRRPICSSEEAIEDSSDSSEGSGPCRAMVPSSPIRQLSDDCGSGAVASGGRYAALHAATSRPARRRARSPAAPSHAPTSSDPGPGRARSGPSSRT